MHTILRHEKGMPVFRAASPTELVLRAHCTVAGVFRPVETPVSLPALVAGTDYAIMAEGEALTAIPAIADMPADAVGGFHFAPGGNAEARHGGDATPAINPCSIWDAGFRPACPDPRGMALVEQFGQRFWCDIYKLGVDHVAKGTSRHGETIADGRDLPARLNGKGRFDRLDYQTASDIYAWHGKQLLSYDEFRAAAYGVTEKSSAPRDPKLTGLDAARTSRFGIMQATGNLWDWGQDGDPDAPSPSLFGGSWIHGDRARSRYANLDYWPDNSNESISARGRCDHAA